jgi:hypothetical protein
MSKIFISHASEDKQLVARPLAKQLTEHGISVWYDEYELKLGDSLLNSINNGLRDSNYGIVILSPNFFNKNWPKYELESLTTLERSYSRKIVLPIWHNIEYADIIKYSAWLADKLAVSTKNGIDTIVKEILKAIGIIDGPPLAVYDLNSDKLNKLNWMTFNTSGKFKNIQLVQENGNPIWNLKAEEKEIVGINLLNLPSVGTLQFEYLIKNENLIHSNIIFYLIPIKKTEMLIEIGFDSPTHPKNPYSFFRQRIRARNLFETWISESVKYDFSDLKQLDYIIFAPRINEGCPFPGKGELLIRNVKVN